MLRIAGYAISLSILVGLAFQPALASTVVVPDDFPSVQLGIDSGADTVQIRAGTYPERPTVDRKMVLMGVGTSQRPRLAALAITNQNFSFSDPHNSLTVTGIDFSGQVTETTVPAGPRLLELRFAQCSLDSGFYQVQFLDAEDILLLAIRQSRLRGLSQAQVDLVAMDADTVDGNVSWGSNYAHIGTCWFRGGLGTAIELHGTPRDTASHNRIENYDTAIHISDSDGYVVAGNSITGCGQGVSVISNALVDIRNNTIDRCGTGIYASQAYHIAAVGNTITHSSAYGIQASVENDMDVEFNIVGPSGAGGIHCEWEPYGASGTVSHNTVFRSGGSGLEVLQPLNYATTMIANNIGFGNGQWGISGSGGSSLSGGNPFQLRCNDWFGNTLGAISGVAKDSSDVVVDPMFCGIDSVDVRLDSGSSLLADSATCGEIGALGVGCGVTPTLVQRFTAARVSSGVEIVWQVADGATASAVWVERAESESGGWTRPITERALDNRAVVELDRSAALDRTYWYRLVAQEGSATEMIGAPIVVEAEAPLQFRLTEVGPSPGGGPLRIAFTLAHDAEMEIAVFDLLGRKVATPALGLWPAGAQVVQWDGLTSGGRRAPSGVYVLQYTYPGGRQRRAIIRIR